MNQLFLVQKTSIVSVSPDLTYFLKERPFMSITFCHHKYIKLCFSENTPDKVLYA